MAVARIIRRDQFAQNVILGLDDCLGVEAPARPNAIGFGEIGNNQFTATLLGGCSTRGAHGALGMGLLAHGSRSPSSNASAIA